MIGKSWKKNTNAGGRVKQDEGYMEARPRQDYRAVAGVVWLEESRGAFG